MLSEKSFLGQSGPPAPLFLAVAAALIFSDGTGQAGGITFDEVRTTV
jgi:hypothetical protein